jgi:light-regulated signal transduction histidine kinase (bacteriophytochrome)
LKEAKALLLKNELELQVNIKELNRSNVELQQFAYVASHDLQEPVRKMIFYSDYLLRKHGEELTPKSTAYLNNMTGAANRMRDLIRDLLTFSQVNQREGQFQPVDLNQTVQEAIQDLEMAITDKEGSIQISQLPVIEGDPLLLRQLFVNLISNSIKYAKKEVAANIEISHQVHAESVVIYVKDNGIGFDPKYVEKLFALFQRLHNREEYAGTGLGLAICRKITDVHNGLITSTAIPGEGATFIITLPLKQQH